MTSQKTKKNISILWQSIIFTILIVVLFYVDFSLDNKQQLAEVKNTDYNAFYQKMPETYANFVNDTPHDLVVDRNEARAKKNRALKYNAYITENGYAREVVAIKKITESDTTKSRPVSFNIYPQDTSLAEKGKKFFKLTTNPVTYRYGGDNYRLARQMLPNIPIVKIEPYSRYWKTTITNIDNGIVSSESNAQTNKLATVSADTENPIYRILFEQQLKIREIEFLPKADYFEKSESENHSTLKQYAKDKKLRLIKLTNDISFWEKITRRKTLGQMHFYMPDSTSIHQKLVAYLDGKASFSDIFDEKKLASYYALLNVYCNYDAKGETLYLIWNEDSELLEPFYANTKKLGIYNTYVKNLKLSETSFLEAYAKATNELLNTEELDGLFYKNNNRIRKTLQAVNTIEPKNLFEPKIVYHNLRILEKSLTPSTAAKIVLIDYSDSEIKVAVENLSNFALEIVELSHKGKKHIATPKNTTIISIGDQREVVFDLPDSYMNLFVHKKKKTTVFIFEKDIFDLKIGYRLLGSESVRYNEIVPFQDIDELSPSQDIFRNPKPINELPYLQVNEQDKTILLSADSIIIDRPIVIPHGYILVAKEGSHIDVQEGGKLISKSAIRFTGTQEKPIEIYSSDRKGQGLIVIKAKDTSVLQHVKFRDLGNPVHGLWDVSGAVSFYENPVRLENVLIADNRCEDGLNIIRSNFTMSGTTFSNTQSDAFDGDFVSGEISNCTFQSLGNDAIDVSGSELRLMNIEIKNAGDKGVSIGEDSKMTAKNIKIYDSEIAVAGKDLSVLTVENIEIVNCKLGFTAFKKKPEFGPSHLTANKVASENIQTMHLIENGSSLILNGHKTETIGQVKDKMYGVEFGVDSRETRVVNQ